MKEIAIPLILLVLISACVQQLPATTTTTTLSPAQEQAVQQAEQKLDQEIESAVENMTTDDIESAITGAAGL